MPEAICEENIINKLSKSNIYCARQLASEGQQIFKIEPLR